MRNLKKARFFSLGRKWFFTLALFVLVFAAASVVKIHAAANITGWLWDGSEDANLTGVRGNTNSNCLKRGSLGYAPGICIDGNETGVGWIKMNGFATDPAHSPYGVSIDSPGSDGNLIGYGWSERLGWIDFNPDADCVSGAPSAGQYQSSNCSPPAGSECGSNGVSKTGNRLDGCARVVSIAQAGANAGGWDGWISMRNTSPPGASYGVDTNLMVGNDSGTGTYAWSGENSASAPNIANGFGSVDFSRASFGPPSPTGCALNPLSPDPVNLSSGTPSRTLTATRADAQAGKTINFSRPVSDTKFSLNGSQSTSCTTAAGGSCSIAVSASDFSSSALTTINAISETCSKSATANISVSPPPTSCSCGSADGKRYCNGEPPAEADKCKSGSLKNLPDNERSYDWTCGSCPCSASKICGWIETNP